MAVKQILRLNFNGFDKDWMLNYAYTHLRDNWSPAPWKKELMYFLIDWYSTSETVNANTSGSTGAPKTILLNKNFMTASARTTLEFFGLKPGDKALLSLPIKYIAAKMMVVRSIAGKLDLYCIPPSGYPYSKLTPEPDFAAFTPAQAAALIETKEGRLFFSRIKTVLLGGAPVNRSLSDALQMFTETEIWHSYGMTETMSHVALRKINGTEASQHFRPLKGVEISLTEDHCIRITAPHIGISGLNTTDIGEIFPDGTFTVQGRKDQVINSGGIKLFPEQMENEIEPVLKTPFFITAKPDEKYGEIPVLVVESAPWDEERRSHVLSLIKTISALTVPPKEIIFLPRFQRTESGKIIRKLPHVH